MPRRFVVVLAAVLGACAEPGTETSAHGVGDIAAVLDALQSARSFDEALGIARAGGLVPIGPVDPGRESRAIVLVDPAQPDVVVAALSTAAQVPTASALSWPVVGGIARFALCGVAGSDAAVTVWPDGKIYAIQGAYQLRLDVCDPASAWACEALRPFVDGAVAELAAAGGARRTDDPNAPERIVVAAESLTSARLAETDIVADARGRKTCTITINKSAPDIFLGLTDLSAADRRLLLAVLEHEMGHCAGLDHAGAGPNRPVMASPMLEDPQPGYSAGERDVLRRIASGETIPLASCKIDCGPNAAFDDTALACRCLLGSQPDRWGGCGWPASSGCHCEGGACVDNDTGGGCWSCSSCERTCGCAADRCVDLATGQDCDTCPTTCAVEPPTCGCSGGACVDLETRAACDRCPTACTGSTSRICGCNDAACVDWETGEACDICPEDCSEDDDDDDDDDVCEEWEFGCC